MLEELSVTGEKVTRDLKQTASSVTVLPGDEIARTRPGATSVTEALSGVPNVILTDTVSAPIIRGQDTQGPNFGANAFLAGTVPRATISVDGHYLSYNEYVFGAASLWDVRSIEVFRGPQTTAQGANAIAGAIIVNTNDPTFTPEAAYLAEIGSYGTKRSALAVSGPFIENELAARLAIDYSARDTFITYANPAFTRGETDEDLRAFNLRLKLLWRPSAWPGFETKLTYSHSNSNRPSSEAANAPVGRLRNFTTGMPTWNQAGETLIHDLRYDFANGFVLYNQAQYTDLTVHRVSYPTWNGNSDVALRNATNETRLTYGVPSDRVSGFLGIFYGNTVSRQDLYLRSQSHFDDTKNNLGLFGEASYRLTDRWTLTGGLRYESDQVHRVGTTNLSRSRLDYDRTFTALLPRVSLAYALTPDWTVGGLVSRGYNPGGVALNFISQKWIPFKAETLTNYELFTRATILDRRLTVNGNLFYTDFDNTQRSVDIVLRPGIVESYVINVEKAHAYGLEAGLDYQALDTVKITLGGGLLRTEFDRFAASPSYVGKRFAKAPGAMASLGASWEIALDLNLTCSVRYVDNYFSDDRNTPRFAIKGYTLADARLAYRLGEHAEIYAYARNLFDQRSPIFAQANRVASVPDFDMTQPRTVGLGVKGTF